MQIGHDGFGQEGLDQVRLQGGQGVAVQRLGAGVGRNAHRAVGAVQRLHQAQARTTARFVQIELLARKDQVRVADVVHVHAPQLGPAPGRAQKQPRDAPQRVAPAHGVFIGRIGRQRRQGHARLRHLLRGGALLARDGVVRAFLRLGRHGNGSCQHGQRRQGETFGDIRKCVFHCFAVCVLDRCGRILQSSSASGQCHMAHEANANREK